MKLIESIFSIYRLTDDIDSIKDKLSVAFNVRDRESGDKIARDLLLEIDDKFSDLIRCKILIIKSLMSTPVNDCESIMEAIIRLNVLKQKRLIIETILNIVDFHKEKDDDRVRKIVDQFKIALEAYKLSEKSIMSKLCDTEILI